MAEDDGRAEDGSEDDEDPEVYTIECILAESWDDAKQKAAYLIKWESYDLFESSWETSSSFEDGEDTVLADWDAVKARQRIGELAPFDVSDFEVKRAAWLKARLKAEKAARRQEKIDAKKKQKQIPSKARAGSSKSRDLPDAAEKSELSTPDDLTNTEPARILHVANKQDRRDIESDEAEEFDLAPADPQTRPTTTHQQTKRSRNDSSLADSKENGKRKLLSVTEGRQQDLHAAQQPSRPQKKPRTAQLELTRNISADAARKPQASQTLLQPTRPARVLPTFSKVHNVGKADGTDPTTDGEISRRGSDAVTGLLFLDDDNGESPDLLMLDEREKNELQAGLNSVKIERRTSIEKSHIPGKAPGGALESTSDKGSHSAVRGTNGFQCLFRYYDSEEDVRGIDVGLFRVSGLTEKEATALGFDGQDANATLSKDELRSLSSRSLVSSVSLAKHLSSLALDEYICADVKLQAIPKTFWSLMNTLRIFDSAAVIDDPQFTAFLYRKQDARLQPFGTEAFRLENADCRILFLKTRVEEDLYASEVEATLDVQIPYRQQLARLTGLLPPDVPIVKDQTILVFGPNCAETLELRLLLKSKTLNCTVLDYQSSELSKNVKIHHIFLHRLMLRQQLQQILVLTRLKRTDSQFWLYGAQVSTWDYPDLSHQQSSIFPTGGSVQITAKALLQSTDRVLAVTASAKNRKWRLCLPRTAFATLQSSDARLQALEFRILLEKEKIEVTQADDVENALMLAAAEQIDLAHLYRRFFVLCHDDEEVSDLLQTYPSGGIEVMKVDDFEV